MTVLPKIIGVGLPKTGTNSLAAALEMLGVRDIEHRPDLVLRRYRMSGRFDIGRLDAVMDINPWPLQAIRRAYPGALLVHTKRPLKEWLVSCEAHFTINPEYNEAGRLEIFGVTRWSREAFEDTHTHHGAYVADFFRNDIGPHVSMDVRDGWGPLCGALGIPQPTQTFPHMNIQGVRNKWTPTAYNG